MRGLVLGALVLVLPAPAPGAAAQAAPRAIAAAGAETPDAHVRRFYAWYLGEIRAGRSPWADDAGLGAYLSAAEISQLRANAPASFDPVLGLPEPRSRWAAMKVAVAKPVYYHRPGRYDAYVEVRYKGFTDPESREANGTRFVGMVDAWTLGLTRTRAGWRIASIGASE